MPARQVFLFFFVPEVPIRSLFVTVIWREEERLDKVVEKGAPIMENAFFVRWKFRLRRLRKEEENVVVDVENLTQVNQSGNPLCTPTMPSKP